MVEKAGVSTKEPEFMSLCLDYQKNIAVDSYLFTDNEKVQYELNSFSELSFRLAQRQDIDEIKNKCDVKNIISKKTLEKSGFIANHRIIFCEF